MKLLRISLSIVFIWFGLLKLFGVSPVFDVVAEAYPFITKNLIFFYLLAIFEIALGAGILVRRLRWASALLMVAHLLFATFGVLLSPQAFASNFPFLSLAGEFVVKNLVLIAAALAVASGV